MSRSMYTDVPDETAQAVHVTPCKISDVADVPDVPLPAGNGDAERYPLVCEHCGAPEQPGNPVQECAVDGLTHLLHRHCQAEWLDA